MVRGLSPTQRLTQKNEDPRRQLVELRAAQESRRAAAMGLIRAEPSAMPHRQLRRDGYGRAGVSAGNSPQAAREQARVLLLGRDGVRAPQPEPGGAGSRGGAGDASLDVDQLVGLAPGGGELG